MEIAVEVVLAIGGGLVSAIIYLFLRLAAKADKAEEYLHKYIEAYGRLQEENRQLKALVDKIHRTTPRN